MSPARPRKPTHLTDDTLLARLVELNGALRLSLTSLLEHIAEVDVRRLFARRGHSSMHRYCVRELNMSDDEAYARIRVARLGRRLPTVLAYLADGRLHLTAARLLASHLTQKSHRAILAEASGLNVAGIKQLVARLAPKPDVPTRVRALPAPRPEPGSIPSPAQPPKPAPTLDGPQSPSAPPPSTEAPPSSGEPPFSGAPPPTEARRPHVAPPTEARRPHVAPPPTEARRSHVAPPLALEAPRPIVAPLAPERFEVRFTASATLIEKLTEVTALLSHAVPDGDLPTVLERALDLARIQLVKRRFGADAVCERAVALVDASTGAAPVTADAAEVHGEGRAPGSRTVRPRDAETRAWASRPEREDESAGRASASGPPTPRDAEARPLASRPKLDESAGRASASGTGTSRDAEARAWASRPAPKGESAGRASASGSATPREAEARPLASRPTLEVSAGRASASGPATMRDAEALPRASRPTLEVSAGRASASGPATMRDAEALPRASRPTLEVSAGRASASGPATPRDAEARSLASRPTPTNEPARRASVAERPRAASCCGARADQVVSKPAPTHEPPAQQRSRYIPAAVRAAVWRRDEGRCTYVDPDTGRACGERRFLELHHEHPFAHGGAHVVEVLTLRCRAHNIWAARLDFGAEHIDACIARR